MTENIITNKDIALYALYLLGGWHTRIHTEDIAVKCFELAPTRFSWVKYPQYPDLAPTRFALEHANNKTEGYLVKGESEKKRNKMNIGGWMLTNYGIEWIKRNKERIEKYIGKNIPIGDRLPSDRKMKELMSSTAFKKFIKLGGNAHISHAEFAESIICTVNSPQEILNDRLEQMYSIAEELDRQDVKNYVAYVRTKFADLLN